MDEQLSDTSIGGGGGGVVVVVVSGVVAVRVVVVVATPLAADRPLTSSSLDARTATTATIDSATPAAALITIARRGKSGSGSFAGVPGGSVGVVMFTTSLLVVRLCQVFAHDSPLVAGPYLRGGCMCEAQIHARANSAAPPR
jgi:hypothetical protein